MNAGLETFEAVNAETLPGAVSLPGVIGSFFSFRVFIVLLTAHVLGADPQTGVALSLGINYLLLVIVVFCSIGEAPRTLTSVVRSPCFFWIFLFLGFSGCSLVWTAAVSVPAAMAFWVAMAADSMMIILLLRLSPGHEVASGFMKGIVYGACCIAIIAWIMPSQSDLRLGDDELLGPNQIGYACALAVFFGQYLLMRSGQLRWKVCTTFLALTVLRSLSKTTIIALVAGEIFILLADKSIPRRIKIMMVAAAVIVVALFWNLLSSYFDIYSNAGGQAETLTGRVGIWAFILDKAIEQPWIGHGIHSVWKVIPPFPPDQFEARHAHNELLQQFYAYGVVGIVMLVGLYSSFYRQVRKLQASPLKSLALGLLIFAIVRGFADTEVFDLSLPLWAIAILAVLVVEARKTQGYS